MSPQGRGVALLAGLKLSYAYLLLTNFFPVRTAPTAGPQGAVGNAES
jgi:hypothetical protein